MDLDLASASVICGGHLRATCRQAGGSSKGARGSGGVQKTIRKSSGKDDCHCCGKTGHQRANCPMKDKECNVCGKTGHIRATCRAEGGGAAKGAKKDTPGSAKRVKEATPTMEGLDSEMDDYFGKAEEETAAPVEEAAAATTEAPMEDEAAAEVSAE